MQHSRTPRSAWMVMGPLWALTFLTNYAGFSLGVMLPEMRGDLGLSPVQAGLLGSSYFVGVVLMAVPSALWLSRYSPRRITLLLGIACGLLALVQGWSPNYGVLLLARLAFMVLSVGRLQAEVMLIQQWFTYRTFSLVNGISFGAIALAQMAGVGATPLFMDRLGGWRGVHYGLGLLLLLVCVAWLRLGREKPDATGQSSAALPAVEGSPIRVLARHPALWLVASAQLGAGVAFGSYVTFWPTFAMDERGMTLAQAGPLLSFYAIGGLLGSFLAGPLSEAIRRRKPVIWTAGLVLPWLYLMLALVRSPAAVAFLFLGAGYFSYVVAPVLFTIPYDMRLRPRENAVASALIRTFTSMGASLGPLLVGVIQQVYGSLFLGLLVVVPLPLSLTVMGLLLPETRRGRAAADAPPEEH